MGNPSGQLYLIPSVLGPDAGHTIPPYVREIVQNLRVFIVEDERTARRFLRAIGFTADFDAVQLLRLDKRTDQETYRHYLEPLEEGHSAGILSEAGCPGVADPGAGLVALAHRKQIQVVPLVGPNSILMALMASGLNGQAFTFHGYLPVKQWERVKVIKSLDQQTHKTGQTQIFMETPYRNKALLEDVVKTCTPDTMLCIACDISLPTEYIMTRSIADWQKNIPDIHKRPAVFLLGR